MSQADHKEGLEKAMELLHEAATDYGFVASVTQKDNYRRIWARDGAIVAIAALQTKDEELVRAAHNTLLTLRKHQGPHGEIPSNVEPETDQVSYGGTAGRVDAGLWFVILAHRYWQYTQSKEFLEEFIPCLKRIEFLLGAWEYNTKGLLYVPETGDWADEYIQHGYVLYDQCLYYQALIGLANMYEASGEPDHEAPLAKAEQLKELIQANYWFVDCDPDLVGAYHPTIFKRGCDLAEEKGAHWMAYFSPTGYGYRFDAMANSLVSLLGIANDEQRQRTDEFIDKKVIREDMKVLPAFSPVIKQIDADWEDLQSTFSNSFKNKPHEFHNGGLWQLINGFYVADLAARGETERANEYLAAIHEANMKDDNGDTWGFYEFLNGETLKPGGTRLQTWSASAAIMGHFALQGSHPFPTDS